jgi:hypothetical protein
MARYVGRIVSQTAQLGGLPSGTTVNGYMGYWGASATSGFRLRRITDIGVLLATGGAPTSAQLTLAVYRQTVAPAGTGIAATVAGLAMETWTPVDPTAGIFAITAATIGTTGPTLSSTTPVAAATINTQSSRDVPIEFTEELIVGTGTANGFGFVILNASGTGTTLPANHFVTLTIEVEV